MITTATEASSMGTAKYHRRSSSLVRSQRSTFSLSSTGRGADPSHPCETSAVGSVSIGSRRLATSLPARPAYHVGACRQADKLLTAPPRSHREGEITTISWQSLFLITDILGKWGFN